MQVDLLGDNTIGASSGIEPALQPSSWQGQEIMSATIRIVFVLCHGFDLSYNRPPGRSGNS